MADMTSLSSYLPYVLRKVDQTLSGPLYGVLNDYGVARSEWRVLAVLSEFGEMSMLALTEAALSPQPTVAHAVRRLEKRNLVERELGTQDRRQRFVSLTESGTQLTALLMGEARRLEQIALAGSGELAGLVAQLTELTTAIEANFVAEAERLASDPTEGTA